MIARIRTLLAIIFTVLAILTARLMYLQFVMAEELTLQSEENVRVDARISPLRGQILARDGTVLAGNRVASDLMYLGGEIEHWSKLSYLLNLETLPSEPNESDPVEKRFGVAAAYNIPDEYLPAVEELVAGQTAFYIRERVERTYPTNLAAQTVGYTAEAKGRFEGYALDELVGVLGIEASMQNELFGEPGKMKVQTDNRGVVISSSVTQSAKPGKDITLTLDPSIQRIAENALGNALEYINDQREARDLDPEEVVRGTLIAMNPNNGEILAMASMPSFDQNVFTHRPTDSQRVASLLGDSLNLPMANRAIEAYPPASTFKLVTSSALLENAFISPYDEYFCSASIQFGGRTWENWSYPDSRGNYDITGAIADSCNTFYWLAVLDTPDARKAGWTPFISAVSERAKELGYGEQTGIELTEEKKGLIPTEEWTNSVYEYGWLPGFSLNTSIGQGDVLATPLQVLQAVSTIALDGKRAKPHLVKAYAQNQTEPSLEEVPGFYWSTLKLGMRRMVTDFGSNYTLGPAANFPVEVAGKTGTAQNAKGTGYDHVWFAGFAPYENPEIAFVVFIEEGDKSTGVAVPVARDFLLDYLEVEGL